MTQGKSFNRNSFHQPCLEMRKFKTWVFFNAVILLFRFEWIAPHFSFENRWFIKHADVYGILNHGIEQWGFAPGKFYLSFPFQIPFRKFPLLWKMCSIKTPILCLSNLNCSYCQMNANLFYSSIYFTLSSLRYVCVLISHFSI